MCQVLLFPYQGASFDKSLLWTSVTVYLELSEENIGSLYNFRVDVGMLNKTHTHTKAWRNSKKINFMKKRAFIKAKMTNLEEA